MSQVPPEEAILTALQELLEAWTDEDHAEAGEKCSFLLKKRKALDASLTSSVQRLLLQSFLLQQEYAKVVAWLQTNNSSEHRDLALYAQYRLEEYDLVSKQASKDSLVEQHLLAQSFFHLDQVNPALRVYQELIPKQSEDDAKMELLTNALAVLSSNVTPYIPLSDTAIPDQVSSFLGDHPEYSDLAYNLGTLQVLTESGAETDWLESAEVNCDDPDDLTPIDINQTWKKHFWLDDVDGIAYSQQGTAAQTAVAKLNQSLLNHTPLPTQPHAKWNSLQVRMYWYNRAVQQFQRSQLVECQESCQSLKKLVGTASGKKKKTEQSSTPSELWWNSRVDVILAHVQHQQSKTDSAVSKLEESLRSLKSEPSSATLDHAASYVQLHLHSLQHPNPSNEQRLKLLQSLPTSIQERPAVIATLEVLGAKVDSKLKKAQDTPLNQADRLFAQGQYEQAIELYQKQLPAPAKCSSDEVEQQLRLVQALAMTGQHDESTKLWQTVLPLLDDVEEPTGRDGEALENQTLPRSKTTLTTDPVNDTKRSKEAVLRQRARRREAYLKELENRGDYNPSRPSKPNAERWIAKHDRSRNRRRQNNRSAQGGGSQADAQKLDAAARRAGNVPSNAGPSTANLKVSGNANRKGGRRRY